MTLRSNKCNFQKVFQNFKVKVATATEVSAIVEECRAKLLPLFTTFGSLRDVDIEKISFMQARFRKGVDAPTESPKDKRCPVRQRCMIIGNKEIELARERRKASEAAEQQAKKDAQKLAREVERKNKVVKTASARKIAKVKPPKMIQPIATQEYSRTSDMEMGCMTLGYRPQKTSSRSKE